MSNKDQQNPISPIRILAGPLSGEIVHDLAVKHVQAVYSGVSLTDFIAEVNFINPYAASQHPWNFQILFRSSIRVAIDSDNKYNRGNTWIYGYFLDGTWTLKHRGLIPVPINLGEGETNHLRLEVRQSFGRFFINHMFVGDLDLSAILTPSNVGVGTSEEHFKQSGAITRFKDFTVYAIS